MSTLKLYLVSILPKLHAFIIYRCKTCHMKVESEKVQSNAQVGSCLYVK